MIRRLLPLVVTPLLVLGALSPSAHASDPHPFPVPVNDPGWARCESVPAGPQNGCDDNEDVDQYGQLGTHADGQPADCPAGPFGQALPEARVSRPDGGLPCFAPLATDPQHAAGVNLPGAWDQGVAGRDDVLIAYIEGGVNYSSDGIKDGLDAVWLNTGELPYPERPDGTSYPAYDADGNGRVDVRDYVGDPRVNPACATYAPHVDVEGTTRSCLPGGQHDYLNRVTIGGTKTAYLSPEDLIAVFGHCRLTDHQLAGCPVGGRFDNDGNGYPGDVSGWNAYRGTNDPQTEDLAYNHAPGLISLLGGQPDNGYSSVGVCSKCRVLPVKQGGECLGRTDVWAQALTYAVDAGAKVISSVVVSYTYSKANQEAVDNAYRHGVVLSLDSNDFDAMDHTDGMLLDHVMPGNSLTENAPAASAVRTFRARSNVTSYGTHNVFSGGETTTSGATPFQAGMFAMVVSAGRDAVDRGTLRAPLTPDEVKQVLMDSSSAVVPQTQEDPVTAATQWPGNADSVTDATHTNWSTQYGYGRPDVGAAVQRVLAGRLPAHAEITSPKWFSYIDPARQTVLGVDGVITRSPTQGTGQVHYVLEWATGADPKDSDFHTASEGDTADLAGHLGDVDLTQVPRSFYDRAPGSTLQPAGAEQFTLTLRLRVVSPDGIKAEDRRTVGLRHDPSLQGLAPRDLQRGEPGPTASADLEAKRELDLVVPTNNGEVHAYRPDGSEVPGFPVYADRLRDIDPVHNAQAFTTASYREDPALRDQLEPLGGGVAVGDLFHDGRLEVLATGEQGSLYAWDSHGRRLAGFPWHMTEPEPQSPTPRAETRHSRLPARGNWSPPVLADLAGDGRLEALVSGYDGKLYALRGDGTEQPGWPVDVHLPAAQRAALGTSYMRDPKLIYPAGVADVLGTGHPQVFVSSFESNGVSTSTENLGLALTGTGLTNPAGGSSATSFLYGIWPDGTNHAGGPLLPHWPVSVPSGSFAYDESIDFVGESNSPPIFLHPAGAPAQVVTAGVTGEPVAFTGDGTLVTTYDAACSSADCARNPQFRLTPDTHTLELTGIPAAGDLDGDGKPEVVASQTGVETILGALGVAGVANLPQVYEKAFSPDGKILSGFPRRVDGFPFYSSPVIAPVEAGSGRAAVEGNDTYWVHAFRADGTEAAGFPKYTGQWMGFTGTVYDPHMDGTLHYIAGTREGYLYDWSLPGANTAANDQTYRYRHDEHNTGDLAADTRRPAALVDLAVSGSRASWTASGDDGMVGTAKAYDVRVATTPLSAEDPTSFAAAQVLAAPAPGAARTPQAVDLPASLASAPTIYVAARMIDKAGNLGALTVACRGTCPRAVDAGSGAATGAGSQLAAPTHRTVKPPPKRPAKHPVRRPVTTPRRALAYTGGPLVLTVAPVLLVASLLVRRRRRSGVPRRA